MRDYLEIAELYQKNLGLVSTALPSQSGTETVQDRCVIFAPHPDDEAVTGLLPLRLRREAGWRVTAVPVTQGSNPVRQEARLREMADACAHLGFDLTTVASRPFCPVTVAARMDQPIVWRGMADKIAALLQREQPRLIILPHARDAHPTHVGTHALVMDALARLGDDWACDVVLTEYWHPLDEPNLMVGAAPDHVALLMTALACHAGEVARNPYHLRLPAWMIDNVRRGAERLAGMGATAPDIPFATLYQRGRWAHSRYNVATEAHVVSTVHPAHLLFGG